MELLKKLTMANATSGNEESIRDIIINEVEDIADEIHTDTLGNLIVHKKGEGKKVMFVAHMDEIGIIVTYVQEDGFLRFSNIGGVSAYNAINSRVVFANGTVGVVSYEQKSGLKDITLSKMYIDIGVSSREEAEKIVNVGDSASFEGVCHFNANTVISKALDDRAGCYILIEAIKRIKNSANDLYFVFTVQEELGLRGAKVSGYSIDPDIAIAVDVTRTGDTPSSNAMAVKVGSGAAIKIKDSSIMCHPYVRNFLIETARTNDIKYQIEVLETGGTDIGAIHTTRAGVMAGGISIPTRYIHSISELASLKDIEECVKLLVAITKCNL